MSSIRAYVCDGPKCEQISLKEPKTRAPKAFIRATVHFPNGNGDPAERKGAFHDIACMQDWLAEESRKAQTQP